MPARYARDGATGPARPQPGLPHARHHARGQPKSEERQGRSLIVGPSGPDRRHERHKETPSMTVTAQTYTGEFYCVKCKHKRETKGDIVETNGRRMAKGVCPECGTKLNRILGKA